MLHEKVLKDSMDHRLSEGIWKAGVVWRDSIDNEIKDVKHTEGQVSGRKKSKYLKTSRDETSKDLKKQNKPKQKSQEYKSKSEKLK